MAGYPVILELHERLVVVVGGGTVGRRKVAGLLAAGASVRLVSCDPVPPGCWNGKVELHQRAFHPEDLDGAVLAFAATGLAAVDRAVREAARMRGIPVTLATDPALGDFVLPAVMRRGDLLIAVATAGQAPALAGVVRDRLAAEFGEEWSRVVDVVARLRREKLTTLAEDVYNPKVLADLLAGGLPELLAQRRHAEIDHLLTRVCGRDVTLSGLGLTWPDCTP